MNTLRRLLLFIVVSGLLAAAVWATLRYRSVKRVQTYASTVANILRADPWSEAVEKVKADRGEPTGPSVRVEVPEELRHYSNRHWFLAAQVAEVKKFKLPPSQDFVDLSAMIQRGEMVPLPPVSQTYILFGVGAQATDGAFSRFNDGQNIELYDEAGLGEVYKKIESDRSKLQADISDLKTQSAKLKKNERSRRSELQKLITARERELGSNKDLKARLDRYYGRPETKQQLLRDYESLKVVARNFNGRSYDLKDAFDRRALKVSMLSSLRPPAVKVMEEIAKAYHEKFDRPLPVSSLVRPEQYQHALRRVNRNATLIDTPPHSTGLAFDIAYAYMNGEEQAFLMNELARMEREGRLEVIRENNANYHIFAFIDGTRPNDALIASSLSEASNGAATAEPKQRVQQTHHAAKPRAKSASKKVERKSRPAQKRPAQRRRR